MILFSLPLQTPLSGVAGRREAVAGPFGGAPTQGAAAGLLRESDNAAAATASAVKFMLIESEAAATSASFQPRTVLRFFLRSSQQPPPPTKGTRTRLRYGQGKKNNFKKSRVGGEIEPKRKGGHTHSEPLNAQTVTMIHRAEQRQRETVCVSGWSRERESGRGMSGENWRRRAHTQKRQETHACLVCCLHTHTLIFSSSINSFSFSFCLLTPLNTFRAWTSTPPFHQLHVLYYILAHCVLIFSHSCQEEAGVLSVGKTEKE